MNREELKISGWAVARGIVGDGWCQSRDGQTHHLNGSVRGDRRLCAGSLLETYPVLSLPLGKCGVSLFLLRGAGYPVSSESFTQGVSGLPQDMLPFGVCPGSQLWD